MRSALGFLTVLGGHAAPDRAAPAWFAVVGALAGLLVGGVWWGAAELWPPALAAVLAVAAGAAVTGMLHLDGLADAADGLLPPLPDDRRLAVMRAPDVGAFGVVAVVLALLAQVLSLATLRPEPLLLAGTWAATRAAMALTLRLLPYAGTGLAAPFAPPAAGAASATTAASAADGEAAGGEAGDGRWVGVAAAGGLVGGLALVVVAVGWPGVAVAAGLVGGFGAVVLLGRRRLGGFTGDVLGAAGVVGETVALLVAAARW